MARQLSQLIPKHPVHTLADMVWTTAAKVRSLCKDLNLLIDAKSALTSQHIPLMHGGLRQEKSLALCVQRDAHQVQFESLATFLHPGPAIDPKLPLATMSRHHVRFGPGNGAVLPTKTREGCDRRLMTMAETEDCGGVVPLLLGQIPREAVDIAKSIGMGVRMQTKMQHCNNETDLPDGKPTRFQSMKMDGATLKIGGARVGMSANVWDTETETPPLIERLNLDDCFPRRRKQVAGALRKTKRASTITINKRNTRILPDLR